MPVDEPEEAAALEVLPEAECLRLLALQRVGRIAFTVDGRPQIFPVTFALDGRMIVFLTAPGTKLAHAPMSHVAFEVDSWDAGLGEGWSVVVQGVAYEVTDSLDRRSVAARRLAVRPLAPGDRGHWIAIQADEISGRRFRLPS